MTNGIECGILTKKVEAHLENSICRAKVSADVAAKKGSDAEGRPRREGDAGGTDKIRIAVADLRRAILCFRFRAVHGKEVAVLRLFLFSYGGEFGQSASVLCFFVEIRKKKKR